MRGRLRGIAVVAAVAALVCGCAGADDPAPRDEPTATASATPQERVEAIMRVMMEQSSFRMTASADMFGETMELDAVQHMEDGVATKIEASFDDGSSDTIRMRVLDGRMYFVAADDYWVSIDLDDPDIEEFGFSMADLELETSIQEIVDATLSVRDAPGRVTIDGATTHFVDVEVDPTKMSTFDMLPGGTDSDLLPSTLTYRFYLDEDGLTRRFACDTELGGEPIHVETTLSDFGEVEDVVAPEVHEPVEVKDLLGSAA